MFDGLRLRHWRAEADAEGIVTLTLDRSDASVNAMAHAVLEELDQALDRLLIEPPKGLIVRSGKSAGFIAGADIHEFAQYAQTGAVRAVIGYGQRVYQKLASLPCPSVAAIHGHCMGGGTELALACTYRVASSDPKTRIGLPEVMLGIHPGWGGSARLPRLIGALQALPLMLTGKTVAADKARALGLVDRVAEPSALLDAARHVLRHPPARALDVRLRGWASNTWIARQILAPIMRRQTAAKVRKAHYPAPFALIEVWRRGGGDVRQRLRLEADSVVRLAATPTAHNLVRVFFLQERLKALAGDAAHGIAHVHVIGAGVMGGDIAAWCAYRGFSVSLQDREMKIIEPALARAKTLFAKRLKTPERVAAAQARLHADPDGTQVAAADLVLEAIYENLDAKRALYAAAQPNLRANALLASNTSSIPLNELARGLGAPERFIGLHFFNPVAQMPLVEVGAPCAPGGGHRATRAGLLPCHRQTAGAGQGHARLPGQPHPHAVHARGHPGAGRRHPRRAAGSRRARLRHADGTDRTGRYRGPGRGRLGGQELAPFLGLELPQGVVRLLDAGKRGKKDGQGFYRWQDGKPVKPDVPKDYRAPDDLELRLIAPLLNEAVACLADGVVDDADLLDAGVIFGTGFAPFRGGPITYIRSVGADVLRAQLQALASTHGPRFAPRPGWDHPALRAIA